MGCCAKKESRVENNSIKMESNGASHMTGLNPESVAIKEKEAGITALQDANHLPAPGHQQGDEVAQKYTDQDSSHSAREVALAQNDQSVGKKTRKELYAAGKDNPSTHKDKALKHHLTGSREDGGSVTESHGDFSQAYNQVLKKSSTNLDASARKHMFADMRSGKSPKRGELEPGKKKASPAMSNRSRLHPAQGMDGSTELVREQNGSNEVSGSRQQSPIHSRRIITEYPVGPGSTSFGKLSDGEARGDQSQVGISPFATKKTRAPTAGEVAYALFKSINAIRTKPQQFVERIERVYIDDLDNNGILMSRDIQTSEGKNAFIEAKAFLETVEPVPKLKLDPGLTVAAFMHSKYMAQTNTLTHTGKDKKNMADRIEELGTILAGDMAENILGSEEADVEEWTLNFVVDDSFPQRAHRKNLFNPDLELLGIGVTCAEGIWYVDLNFASGGYRAKTQKINAAIFESKTLKKYIHDCFKNEAQ